MYRGTTGNKWRATAKETNCIAKKRASTAIKIVPSFRNAVRATPNIASKIKTTVAKSVTRSNLEELVLRFRSSAAGRSS